MSISLRNSDQSDRCWNYRYNNAILSLILTLVAYARRSEFTKFEASLWIKVSWILKCLWNYFRSHYIDVRWCTSKWTLGHRRKKSFVWGGGVKLCVPFHYLILFITSSRRKLHFLDIRWILLVNWTGRGIHRYKLKN